MKTILFIIGVLLLANPCPGVVEPVNTKGLAKAAIKGYDPVAYFTESQPIKGSKKLTYKWKGAIWYFSNGKNRDLFVSDPEKYAPQYGGYCAYAMAEGKVVGIDPSQFTLIQEKLYLNYSRKVSKKWAADRENYIRKANKHWRELLEKK